ncbi:uncharacterized protein LOC124405812 isoform X1 [Diprion similis]|uniref:uncharacterized protein LOC124405812 isoform X1 n=1 Tax=Diprion similis TaxID=362088 RepID=UPI001EF79C40|nr:uncharacterized protein LOC124405812 isoform X1 [Diprion similis]XP_046736988.1 uncharacterized protein LOC124405812 isoform X1 [Diprion similis]
MDGRVPPIIVGPMPDPDASPTPEVNATYPGGTVEPGGVVVRAEEALIVILVLVLWVAAIALFFNRWGKIRMLEPYQPKFQQQHRQSCAMIDPNPVQHRACSKFNIHCLEHPIVYPTGCGSSLSRPRQNSVFVGSSMSLLPPQNAPRRAKSAFDIQTLVMAEGGPQNVAGEFGEAPKRAGRESAKIFCESLRLPDLPRSSNSLLQRQRGMSICHFDRTDVLARPLMRERGMSICHFDRGDSVGKPAAVQRERGMSICQFDKQMPSCSKTPDSVHAYRATCV